VHPFYNPRRIGDEILMKVALKHQKSKSNQSIWELKKIIIGMAKGCRILY
jgi:hypothetical protein